MQRKSHTEACIFGSVLRDDFRPDSDVDVLAEIIGWKVDLRTANDLSRYFRDDVIAEAEVEYAA